MSWKHGSWGPTFEVGQAVHEEGSWKDEEGGWKDDQNGDLYLLGSRVIMVGSQWWP